MSKNSRYDQMKTIQSTALELFRQKNIDYGDAFAEYGVVVQTETVSIHKKKRHKLGQ